MSSVFKIHLELFASNMNSIYQIWKGCH